MDDVVAPLIYVAYAVKDKHLYEALENQLGPLVDQGKIYLAHSQEIPPGKHIQQAYEERIAEAAFVLFLVSADFLSACKVEMELAMKRHESGKTRVIPLIMRFCNYKSMSFASLQCLPRSGIPAAKEPTDLDENLYQVVLEIEKIIDNAVASRVPSQGQQEAERRKRLHAMLADHMGFLKDRLGSFVGREQELTDVRQRIEEKLPTGGYVTITGQAGQGKSSMIAKLIEGYGIEKVAFHFIPFSPGPDHQVGLLRNLMARLILKYGLSDLYVATESRPALRDYLPRVLEEVAAKGGQERIFIDGLDQLEEDMTGVRDLSFLPNNPPDGIVFILGTRPNDALEPLELLKPHTKYDLAPLSRHDFDLILQHRQVQLQPALADRFYEAEAIKQNALYLDLLAKELYEQKELHEQEAEQPEAIIARLASNPDHIFSLSLARLKRRKEEWRDVLKPILGRLLVAREPLASMQLKDLLSLDSEQLKDGLKRLGGLIADAGQGRYTLFHLKLRDYLQQDKNDPEKEYLFDAEEVRRLHADIATWCEKGGLSSIWQDVKNNVAEQGRHVYARKHYIAHLYDAKQYQRLFDTLNDPSYGHAKERYDVSTRSFAQDLDLGRQAAASPDWTFEEGLALLPNLWRYTYLRCNLRSRSDHYPSELFHLMLMLGREQEVLGHAELLTDLARKVSTLLHIAQYLAKRVVMQVESQQLLSRAKEVAYSISNKEQQESVLRDLTQGLAQAQQWEQAKEVAQSISNKGQQVEALQSLAQALIRAKRWEQAQPLWLLAQEIAQSISDQKEQAEALRCLVQGFAQAQQWEQAKEVAQSISNKGQQAEALRCLAKALAQAQQWERAEMVARSISNEWEQVDALQSLAQALVRARRWEQAEPLWFFAQEVAQSIPNERLQANALQSLVQGLAQAQRWEWAETMARSISDQEEQAYALQNLAQALVQAQQWEQAEPLWRLAQEIAQSIPDKWQQAYVLRSLVHALAQAQRWEQAETVARSVSNEVQQAEALQSLVQALAQVQQWEQAQEVAHSISDQEKQVEVLSILATIFVERQQQKWGEALYIEAEKIVHSISSDKEQQESILPNLVQGLAQAQRWEQAETVVRSISNEKEQAYALQSLVQALAQAQQWEQAEPLWVLAQEVTHSIPDPKEQTYALRSLVQALARIARWEQAETVARSISNEKEQVYALQSLAQALAQAQRWEQAETVAQSLPDKWQQANALQYLVRALARIERWEQAETVARSISNKGQQAEALRSLVQELAQAQQWKWGETVARSISNEKEQAYALQSLAQALVRTQRLKQAEPLWVLAQEVAQSVRNEEERMEVLRSLAQGLAQAQQWEQAETVVRSISDKGQQAEALRSLAQALAQAQQWERAEMVTQSIFDNEQQAYALQSLAQALVRAKRWEQAEPLWLLAQEVAQSVRNERLQANALHSLVQELAQAQRWEQAQTVACSISNQEEQASALQWLVQGLTQVQRWEQAEQVAYSIVDEWQQIQAFGAIIEAFLKYDEHERAFSILQHLWLQVEKRDEALKRFPLGMGFIALKPDLGMELFQAMQWVDAFLGA